MTRNESKSEEDSVPFVVRLLDVPARFLVKTLIVLTRLRARDPREHPAHLLKPDPTKDVQVRGWQAVLEWSPGKRVGCLTGVLLGAVIGGLVIWWSLR